MQSFCWRSSLRLEAAGDMRLSSCHFSYGLGSYVSRKVGDRGRWVGALEGYKQDGHATITSKEWSPMSCLMWLKKIVFYMLLRHHYVWYMIPPLLFPCKHYFVMHLLAQVSLTLDLLLPLQKHIVTLIGIAFLVWLKQKSSNAPKLSMKHCMHASVTASNTYIDSVCVRWID